jgi:predicted amidohydrolase
VAVVTVAALQPSLSWLSPEANFLAVREMAVELAQTGPVDVIVLPEAFDGVPAEMDTSHTSDAARDFVAALARDVRAHIVGGSVACRRSSGQVVNACFVADRRGRIVGEYLKRRLFATELVTRIAGESPGIFDLDGLRVGVLICSDLWYPDLARELCGRVDLVCVPSKTTVRSADSVLYARTLWWSLAMTRAVENVLPVAVSDWCNKAHAMHHTAGAASLNDPAGRPDVARVQQRIQDGAAGFLMGRVDLDAVGQIRKYRQSVGLLPAD